MVPTAGTIVTITSWTVSSRTMSQTPVAKPAACAPARSKPVYRNGRAQTSRTAATTTSATAVVTRSCGLTVRTEPTRNEVRSRLKPLWVATRPAPSAKPPASMTPVAAAAC
jgi:hypothetical protein